MGTLERVGVALAVLPGTTCPSEAVEGLTGAMGVALLLVGVGYVGVTASVLVDYRGSLVYATGVGYTLLSIGACFLVRGVGRPGTRSAPRGCAPVRVLARRRSQPGT